MADWYSLNSPSSPLNDEQRRCLLVLQEWQRLYNLPITGRNRDDGGFRPCGDGIIIHLHAGTSLATYDDDGLTRLVLAAHRRSCRVEIRSDRTGMKIQVNPRVHDPKASLYSRHPSLGDLAAICTQEASK